MAEKLSGKEFLVKMQEYEEFFREHSGVIREYLFNRRFEQDMAETRRLEREAAEIKGEKKGKKKTALENARNLLKQDILSIEQIAQALNLPVKTVAKLKN